MSECLCPINKKAIYSIKALGFQIVEIGAGEGKWAKKLQKNGVAVKAWDIFPLGKIVRKGDHFDAGCSCSALLAVWPPDGNIIQNWIKVAKWKAIILCANFLRIELGSALNGFYMSEEMQMPLGKKGNSSLNIYLPI